jgi:hypothetical protein
MEPNSQAANLQADDTAVGEPQASLASWLRATTPAPPTHWHGLDPLRQSGGRTLATLCPAALRPRPYWVRTLSRRRAGAGGNKYIGKQFRQLTAVARAAEGTTYQRF